jgi:hypothetical protein
LTSSRISVCLQEPPGKAWSKDLHVFLPWCWLGSCSPSLICHLTQAHDSHCHVNTLLSFLYMTATSRIVSMCIGPTTEAVRCRNLVPFVCSELNSLVFDSLWWLTSPQSKISNNDSWCFLGVCCSLDARLKLYMYISFNHFSKLPNHFILIFHVQKLRLRETKGLSHKSLSRQVVELGLEPQLGKLQRWSLSWSGLIWKVCVLSSYPISWCFPKMLLS